MASVSELIGLSDNIAAPISRHPSILDDPRVNPDSYPGFTSAAASLGTDIRTAYADALAKKEAEEKVQDRYFLDRAREYVELNEQVEASASLLTDLASFLSTFQRDLSAVSGHISELQGRSKNIEGRLDARKAVEASLSPLLTSIVIPPELVRLITDTEVSDAWVPAIIDLNLKLGAIRSGPRIASRRLLDDAAEALRILAAQKILNHFISLLKPFTLSVTLSLQTLQEEHLLPLKPLFDFLWQHAARQAHEFQKAYVATVRWYYETGFRRYVRALEKVRLRSGGKEELIGAVTSDSATSLALLAKKNHVASGSASNSEYAGPRPIDFSEIAGPGVILTHMAADSSLKPSREALFRSISLVLMDNATTEYTFISTFFFSHSSLPSLPSTPNIGSSLFSPPLASSSTFERMSRESSVERLGESREMGDGESTVAESERGGSVSGVKSGMTKEEKVEKARRSGIDGVWKSVMEPATEYARNFSIALLDPLSPPSPLSLLAMTRLNESIISHSVDSSLCPPLESYLIGLRLSLWPAFAKVMNAHIDSLKKINVPESGGLFGSGKSGVKDSAVQIIALRYSELFNACVGLSGEQDEEMVFSSILRLRAELDKLLLGQASKIPDPAKQKAFLATHYEELLQGLSAGLSTHPRSQTEVAHYRELARKLRRP